jgi:ribosomal protein S18 acetylase RimI-like enzyme
MPLRRPWAFERGTLWAIDLDVPAPAPASAATPAAPASLVGAAFGAVTSADVAELDEVMGPSGHQEAGARLASGRRCYVARIAGVIAAYGWVSQGRESIGELERELRLRPGEAYIWDCATLPAFRRRGLYSALLCYIVGVLRAEGMRRLWIGASLDNTPSLRGFTAAGFRPALRLVYLRVLGVRGNWLVGAAAAPPTLVADARRALGADRERASAAGLSTTVAHRQAIEESGSWPSSQN